MSKFYYGPTTTQDDSYRLSPSPTISISTEINYANDIIIGYSYIVNIQGYATNYQKHVDVDGDENIRDIRKVLSTIELVRETLSSNGNNLAIYDDEDSVILVAKGGTLRSLSFSPSSNNWIYYSEYSAELIFNELELLGEEIACANSYIEDGSISSNLVDIKKYKIKEFTDNWSFSVDDSNLNYVINSDASTALNMDNSSIGVQYTVSATGKNYFIDGELSPAWIQAKNFVQDRLYDQVSNLTNVLKLSGATCEASDSLSQIHSYGSGLAAEVYKTYKTFNETISCSASETDGTFNVTYSAILKNNKAGGFTSASTIHKVTKDISTSSDGLKDNVTISINGTIEGLCNGGISQSSGNFVLQPAGTLLVSANTANKFNNAEALLGSILVDSVDDLSSSFKTALNINLEELGIGSGQFSTCSVPSGDLLLPASFNLTKNYMEGNISYSAEYTTDRACSTNSTGRRVVKTNITINEPVPIIAEFPVPGGSYIIQDIATTTAKTISFTAEGVVERDCCSTGQDTLNEYISEFCGRTMEDFFSFITFPDEENFTVTDKNYTYNIIEGTFNINLSYTCKTRCET
jgi:hypothetical protein